MAALDPFVLVAPDGRRQALRKGRLVAGAGEESDVSLDGPGVGAAHLILTVTGDRVYCQAATPAITFLVNGQPTSSHVLQGEDSLQVADTTYRILQVAQEPRPAKTDEIVHPRAAQSTIHDEVQRALTSGVPYQLKQQLDVMYRLARLVESVTDRQRFTEGLLDLVLEVLPVDRAMMVTFPEGEAPRVEQSRPLPSASPGFAPSATVLRRVSDSGVALITSDAPGDARLEGSESITALSIRRVICAPMRYGRDARGALYADGQGDGEVMTDAHLGLMESIASYAGVALERAALYRSLQERELHTHLLVHDMKNPLASIFSGLGLLEVTLPDHALQQAGGTLDLLRQAADQLDGYISDILDVAQLEAGLLRLRLQHQDLAGLLEALSRRWAPALSFHGRALEIQLEAGPGERFSLDERLVSRVLDNLVANAVNHTPAGTPITVRAAPGDEGLEVQVRDQGDGVPEEARERIFEKFGRAAGAPSGGKGLGLYFCRLVAEAHGGRLHVEGAAGDNRFVLFIPRRQQEER